MRKIVYSMAAVLLLTACTNETKGKSQEQSAMGQEVIAMNEELLGKWQGVIDIPQMPLEAILNLQQDTGTLTVPAQGLSGFSLESVKYDDQQLNITIDLAGSVIKITGTLENNQIDATFTQNGQMFPLLLHMMN